MEQDEEIILATRCVVLYQHRPAFDQMNRLGAAGHLPLVHFEGYHLPLAAKELLIRNKLEICN
jgi:hypothetical protein